MQSVKGERFMAVDNVVLNKMAAIERCISRINEEYMGHEKDFETNYTKQDSIILNLERVCQASIDLAAHLVRLLKLGIPQESRELFQLLEQSNVISPELGKKLQSMVGFRNLAVHDYQAINLDVVHAIIKNNLDDIQSFAAIALKKTRL